MLTHDATLPVTGSQQGLLVVHNRAAGLPVYNMLVRFDLDPAHGPAAVEAALTAMVATQPAMRQVFGVLPRLHGRLTPPPAALPLERVVVDAKDYEDEVATTARRIGRPEFDLENGPAYRFATVRAADGSASAVILADHHIILDGYSLGPMVADLERMLAKPPTDAETAALAADREQAYIRELLAQDRVAGSDSVAERARTWAARLRDLPPLELSPAPGRPTQTGFTGGRVRWLVDAAGTAALERLCRRLDVTPFVVFSAVYGAVLARHGDVPKVLVGSPFMARRTPRAFDLCGFFVNTLPVSVAVDWDSTVADHLRAVRREVDFCRSNVDIDFTRLVAEVGPDRTSNRNPLFSAMLAMQDTFTPEPGGAVRGIGEPGNGTAKFDLWLGATPVDGRWLLELEYDRELIAPTVADGLLDSLRTALRTTLCDPSARLADLFADASAAISRRTDGWRPRLRVPEPTPADGRGAAEPTMLDCIDAVARHRPTAVAVEDGAARITYADLVARSERIAGGLAELGIGPHVVGITADNLVDTVAVILAVLRRGGTFLPFDESLPADRLAYMAKKAACPLVVGREVVPGVPAVAVKELEAAAPVLESARADAPVYVMFTSGSTGAPKGVVMGQRWLAHLAAWQVDLMRMDGDSRFLQYAPLGFDVCFQEIVPTLVAGGTVVSREPADRRDFPAVLRRIADSEATHVYLPVAVLRPVVQLALDRGLELPALRFLCVSGEQLLVDDQVREFFVRHPHCVLINHYGPTETQAATTHHLSGADAHWPPHVPVGTPLPGVVAYVVDATGHLAPPGVPGELFLGGDCPAEGYVNDPELTAARFVPDRFSGTGGTMYRTGDLVLRNERGELVFLGRRDTQVKIRGNRVELSEVEVVANRVLGVRQAVAVVRGAGPNKEIALVLLPHADAVLDPDRVREHLVQTLPSYMTPSWICTVDAVPTTATGKTDRTALLRLVEGLLAERGREQAAQAGPPDYLDDLERDLAGVWARVLKAEAVLRDRPLMEYGAHSLNIFTTIAEIQQTHGVVVELGAFFASPTVATLAALVRSAKAGA